MDNNFIIQRIKKMYVEYGVDTGFLDALDDERKIKDSLSESLGVRSPLWLKEH